MSESRASRIIDTALRAGVALQDLEREVAKRRAAWNAGYGVDQTVLAGERFEAGENTLRDLLRSKRRRDYRRETGEAHLHATQPDLYVP